ELIVVLSSFLFFFSSRRRHTRFSRDWSSDVCSSDLRRGRAEDFVAAIRAAGGFPLDGGVGLHVLQRQKPAAGPHGRDDALGDFRSEERRVGKECRAGGEPHRWKRDTKKEGRRTRTHT